MGVECASLLPILAQAGGSAQGQSLFGLLFPFLLVFGIMYFFIIRPMRQRQKSHEQLLRELKNGDKVVTQGGIRGTVSGIQDDAVLLRVADNVKIELNKSAIATRQSGSESAH